MANVSKIAGLVPIRSKSASDWDGRGNVYHVASTDTTILSVGDPVKLTGTGDANGIPGVTRATAGATCVGAILAIGTSPQGPYIDFNDLTKVNAPGTKLQAYYCLVADDPFTEFEIQESSTVLTAAAIGLNANFVAADPGTGVRVSQFTLDGSSVNTTDTLNLLQQLQFRVDYEAWHFEI